MSFQFHNPLSRVFSPFGIARSSQPAAKVEPPPAPVVDPEANSFYIVLFDKETDKPVMTKHAIFDTPAKGVAAPAAIEAEAPVTPAPGWIAPREEERDLFLTPIPA